MIKQKPSEEINKRLDLIRIVRRRRGCIPIWKRFMKDEFV